MVKLMFAFTEYPPSPPLRAFVHSYGCFASLDPAAVPHDVATTSLDAADPLMDRVIPAVHVMLNFNLAGPFALCRAGGPELLKERAHVIGPVTRPGRMQLPERVAFLGVCFHPGCAQLFFGVPADELTDQFLALEDVWGAVGRALPERLLEARSVQEMIGHVEAELLRRLAAARQPDQLVRALAEGILRCRGRTTVERLSAACGFTRQHLARRFRRCLGVGPKLFCRLVRFENTLARVTCAPPHDWASAALELGYYDQAHLIAEFKEFTGLTPTAFASRR
jgi:AraC-like DNA-binding protein